MEQLALDVTGMVRANATDTEVAAARTALRSAPRHRDRVLLELLRSERGLTDFELEEITGVPQTSIGKRRGELRDSGLVEDSGQRRTNARGSQAIVWVLTAAGSAYAEQLVRFRPPARWAEDVATGNHL